MIFRLNPRFRGFPKDGGAVGILSLLLVGLFLAGCKKPAHLHSSANPPADFQLPMNLSVRDKGGRTLEIQLLSRSAHSMTFVRLADGLEFTFPLNRLSPDDQALVRKFPQTNTMPSDTSVAGQYIASRRKAIARLTEDIAELRVQIASGDLTTSTIKAKSAELERKLAEIKKMTDQITEKQKSG